MIKTLSALLFLSSFVWAQDPPPPPRRPETQDPVPGRPERRDPFDGPRVPNPPQPPGVERRPMIGPMLVPTDEVRAWLKDNEPETLRRLEQLQAEGRREEVARLMSEIAPRIRELKEMKERDPKGFEKMIEMRRLERESMEQAEQARRAPPEDREAAAKKLKETLSRLFDMREEMRLRELAELKRRVEALEKALADRKTPKERIVEKRRRELMGEKSEDDW
jgi:hypothetical protein